MGRKPRIQSRAKRTAKSPRAGRRIYQCMLCGALTDPIYGVGDNSWCPSCHASGETCYAEGQIPDPAFYGRWLKWQKENPTDQEPVDTVGERPKRASGPLSTAPAPSTALGGIKMKTPKYHSGTFHCPECAIEFDLIAEQVLKCDQCGGLLVKGSLADYTDDDEDENE